MDGRIVGDRKGRVGLFQEAMMAGGPDVGQKSMYRR